MGELQNEAKKIPEWVFALIPADEHDNLIQTVTGDEDTDGEVFEIEDLKPIRVPEYDGGAEQGEWFLGLYSRGLRVYPDGRVEIFLLDGEGRPVRFAPPGGGDPEDFPSGMVYQEAYPVREADDVDKADAAIERYVDASLSTYFYWAGQTGKDPLDILFSAEDKPKGEDIGITLTVQVSNRLRPMVIAAEFNGEEISVSAIPWGVICTEDGLLLDWEHESRATFLSKVGQDILFRKVNPHPGDVYTITVASKRYRGGPSPEDIRAKARKADAELKRKWGK